MASNIERAIIKTLIYADIFDYPLTLTEIEKYLIKVKNQPFDFGEIRFPFAQGRNEKVKITIKNLKNKKILYEKDGYYFLQRKKYIVKERKERKVYSERKIEIACKVASFLKFIPSVKLIGITGALAVNNSKKDDDLDLIVITSSKLLWTTRFLVTLLVELLGVRRHPGGFVTSDKICLNMFLDEEHLSLPIKDRDLFSAHEIIQVKPIYDRNQTYQRFLQENLWVKKYLPNGLKFKMQKSKVKSTIQKSKIFLMYIESVLKSFQLWYMRKRRTTEVINEGIIRFHPEDARVWVMKKYKQKVSSDKYG